MLQYRVAKMHGNKIKCLKTGKKKVRFKSKDWICYLLNNYVMIGNHCLNAVFFTGFGVNWKKINYKTDSGKKPNKNTQACYT